MASIGHYRPLDARSIEAIGKRLYQARRKNLDLSVVVGLMLDAADDMYALLCSLATVPAEEEASDEG
jgi:hypothetical protein